MLKPLTKDASGAAAANLPHVHQAAKASRADAASGHNGRTINAGKMRILPAHLLAPGGRRATLKAKLSRLSHALHRWADNCKPASR